MLPLSFHIHDFITCHFLRLSLGQDPSSHSPSRNTSVPGLALRLRGQANPDVVVVSVLDDDRAGAIRVNSSNRLNTSVRVKQPATSAVDNDSALGDVARELAQHVVVNLLLVAAAVGADGDETGALVAVAAAGQGRAAAGEGAESPGDDAVGPVLQREQGEARAVDPVGGADGGPALGHVLLLAGELVVELGEGSPVLRGVAGIAVPSSGLDVLVGRVHDSLGVRVDV